MEIAVKGSARSPEEDQPENKVEQIAQDAKDLVRSTEEQIVQSIILAGVHMLTEDPHTSYGEERAVGAYRGHDHEGQAVDFRIIANLDDEQIDGSVIALEFSNRENVNVDIDNQDDLDKLSKSMLEDFVSKEHMVQLGERYRFSINNHFVNKSRIFDRDRPSRPNPHEELIAADPRIDGGGPGGLPILLPIKLDRAQSIQDKLQYLDLLTNSQPIAGEERS